MAARQGSQHGGELQRKMSHLCRTPCIPKQLNPMKQITSYPKSKKMLSKSYDDPSYFSLYDWNLENPYSMASKVSRLEDMTTATEKVL
jgi:hypothetical protein